MINPTASLTIDRTGLALAALTFSGVDDGSPLGLVDMSEPATIPRVMYADTSAYVGGSLPTSSVWEQTNLSAVVKLTAATPAALDVLKGELRAALGQFSYDVTQTVNGVSTVWAAHMGSIAPASDVLQFEDLRRVWQSYRLTVPVQPLEA